MSYCSIFWIVVHGNCCWCPICCCIWLPINECISCLSWIQHCIRCSIILCYCSITCCSVVYSSIRIDCQRIAIYCCIWSQCCSTTCHYYILTLRSCCKCSWISSCSLGPCTPCISILYCRIYRYTCSPFICSWSCWTLRSCSCCQY